jgi:hypothetical protein
MAIRRLAKITQQQHSRHWVLPGILAMKVYELGCHEHREIKAIMG